MRFTLPPQWGRFCQHGIVEMNGIGRRGSEKWIFKPHTRSSEIIDISGYYVQVIN